MYRSFRLTLEHRITFMREAFEKQSSQKRLRLARLVVTEECKEQNTAKIVMIHFPKNVSSKIEMLPSESSANFKTSASCLLETSGKLPQKRTEISPSTHWQFRFCINLACPCGKMSEGKESKNRAQVVWKTRYSLFWPIFYHQRHWLLKPSKKSQKTPKTSTVFNHIHTSSYISWNILFKKY